MKMNVRGSENEIRYVFAVTSSNNKHSPNKVQVENVHPNAVEHAVCTKKIAELQHVAEEIKDSSNDDVELTIISECEAGLVVGNVLDHKNMTDGVPAPKKQKLEESHERNAPKSRFLLRNGHLLVQSSMNNYTPHQSTDEDDIEYVPLSTYQAKSVSEEVSERRQGKYKLFRDEWLEIDIFRDWLDRDPTNPHRARCVACNTTMNAGKSELEKHAAGARHERAVEAMHQTMLQQLAAAQPEEQGVEIMEDEDSSNETRQIHSVSIDGATEPVMEPSIHSVETTSMQLQQLEAMNRVASAIESVSSNISVLIEKLVNQQGDIISVLHALQKKTCPDVQTE